MKLKRPEGFTKGDLGGKASLRDAFSVVFRTAAYRNETGLLNRAVNNFTEFLKSS
jgi:hypothetical protein